MQMAPVGSAAYRTSRSALQPTARPLVRKVHHPGGICGDRPIAEAHRLATGQLADMQAHMGNVEHVGAERIPGSMVNREFRHF
jgi:hypothetical protein